MEGPDTGFEDASAPLWARPLGQRRGFDERDYRRHQHAVAMAVLGTRLTAPTGDRPVA